jgi:hypothetical protein
MQQHPNWLENFGSYPFDVDQELSRGGLRPLRELP